MAIKAASGYPQLSGSLIGPLFSTSRNKTQVKKVPQRKPVKKAKHKPKLGKR